MRQWKGNHLLSCDALSLSQVNLRFITFGLRFVGMGDFQPMQEERQQSAQEAAQEARDAMYHIGVLQGLGSRARRER